MLIKPFKSAFCFVPAQPIQRQHPYTVCLLAGILHKHWQPWLRIVLASVTLNDLAVILFYFIDFFFLACFLDMAPRAEMLSDVWGKSSFPDCVGYLVFIRTLNSGWDNICFSCFFIPFSIFCFWLSSCSLPFLPWGRNQRYRMLQQEINLHCRCL